MSVRPATDSPRVHLCCTPALRGELVCTGRTRPSQEPAGVGGVTLHLWWPPWRGGAAVATLALCPGSQGEAEGS